MMEKKYARLAALLAAAVLCGNGAPSMADELVGSADDGWSIVIDRDHTGSVYGHLNDPDANGIVTGHVEMTDGTVGGEVYGGFAEDAADVKDSTVTITGGTVDSSSSVYGGCGNGGEATDNRVTITGGTVKGNVYGGRMENGNASGNTVTITGGTVGTVDNSNGIYGGCGNGGAATYNTVTITGGTVGTVGSSSSVHGGCSNTGAATGNRVTITDGTVNYGIYGGWGLTDATNNRVTITGGTVKGNVYGGRMENGNASGNTVTISGGTVGTVDSSRSVYGGYSASTSGKVSGNTVTITGGIVTGDVYGGYSYGDSVTGNTVALSGDANVEKAALYGWKLTDEKGGAPAETADNDLIIDDWTGSTQSVKNFETIRFQGVTWVPNGTILTITNGEKSDLKNTKVDAENLVIHGSTPQAGESMTFIKNEKADTGLSAEQAAGGFTQGVATAGTAEWDMQEDGKTLNYKITGVFRNRQTDLIAENRLAGAAFVNQGADIAADSLRLLDDGYHFGTQTFGAVYGNRSTYDVASDIKINGWSEIAGFGNIHEVKGGRLAWGVFYENGTGNYRTWNTFNNEMFRGDGSLLYNGGGAAIRLTKDSGMYYEASLRAGTLSSSMSNAVKDGDGNSYGFDSDSTYWGAHVGAGKLIQRGSGQWDIYGKYFHTDIDGDSFEMGGDRFSFDSVTSDRLRLGARYTADTDKAWSLYCGAAYEYEFSGGSRMKAGQFEAPEQSLQGSTVFGEIGTVWGRKDSPWSMDVNLRGYAGEREGFSGMVQLAYAF